MIKNLLFDLGGVIMDIRRQNCEAAFRRLGMNDIDRFLGDYGQKGPFLKLEEGKITEEEFREEVRRHIPEDVDDAAIDNAFNQFLVGIPLRRLQELRKLRERFGIYLLSNTNSIMWNSRIAEEFRKDGHDRDYYFDGCVTSFEARCYKPDAAIFRETLRKFGLNAPDVVFFDDSQANCDAAARLGFKTVWVAPGQEFYNLEIPRSEA